MRSWWSSSWSGGADSGAGGWRSTRETHLLSGGFGWRPTRKTHLLSGRFRIHLMGPFPKSDPLTLRGALQSKVALQEAVARCWGRGDPCQPDTPEQVRLGVRFHSGGESPRPTSSSLFGFYSVFFLGLR